MGDVPIHSANGQAHASADTQAAEAAAAERLFGLLPAAQGAGLRALWDEFEAAETPDAVFAKSLDRVQPVMANLMSGGGTWITYQVTAEQLESRVGAKVARGAPGIWHWVRAQTRACSEPTGSSSDSTIVGTSRRRSSPGCQDESSSADPPPRDSGAACGNRSTLRPVLARHSRPCRGSCRGRT